MSNVKQDAMGDRLREFRVLLGPASGFSPGTTIILRLCESVNLKKTHIVNNPLLIQKKIRIHKTTGRFDLV